MTSPLSRLNEAFGPDIPVERLVDFIDAMQGEGLTGFGGECFGFALALREIAGRGRIVLAVNAALWEASGLVVGHAALEIDGFFLDGEGEEKEWEEIESWAMLDHGDPDWIAACPGLDEEGAGRVTRMDFPDHASFRAFLDGLRPVPALTDDVLSSAREVAEHFMDLVAAGAGRPSPSLP